MRVLVVGDIHGALEALLQVLQRCGYDKDYDKIIFIGDYVDGWSQSAEVIDFLITLQNQSVHGHIFLRGNHDKWCEDWLAQGTIHPYWLNNGGQTTKDSYIESGLLAEDSHRMFFRRLHDFYIDDQNRGFVHGGFVSRKGIGHDPYRSDYHWDRDLWELALLLDGRRHEGETSKARRFEKHKEVYIGHTATENWKCKPHYREFHMIEQEAKNGPIVVPMKRCNVWNVDTGCGWNGKLTIMDIDTKQFWQSDFVNELYPDEIGRD